MKCLVVDDDPMSRKSVEHCVGQVDYLELVDSCASALEALNILDKKEVDLLFLDVEMPEMSGIDLIKSTKNIPQVILITSKKDYAAEAFEYDVVDYIVKPIEMGRFTQALSRVKEKIQAEAIVDEDNDDISEADRENIFVKTDKRLFKILPDDILWIEALGDYVTIVTTQRKYTIHSSMKKIEAKMPAKYFVRTHRSYIVNVHKIRLIEDTILAIEDKVIPIGQSFRKGLMQRLNIV